MTVRTALNPPASPKRNQIMNASKYLFIIFAILPNIHSVMIKNTYLTPLVEISGMMGENIICASGTNGSNEDFGKGNGFTPDLFESLKPF